MKKKFKLHGLGNDGKYQYFTFQKNQGLLQLFEEIIIKLGLPKDLASSMRFGDHLSKQEKKQTEQSVKHMKDEKHHFTKGKDHIDFIFSDKDIFVIAYLEPASRQKVIKLIKKNCSLN